jgi:hypothetical protein
MQETKSSTKILMVSLVLILAAASFVGGYYFGRDSVVCPHSSHICASDQTDEDEDSATEEEIQVDEEEPENHVASYSVKDIDYKELLSDLGYEIDLDQSISEKEYYDLTGDGEEEVIFSVYSGGTAGDIAVYVYGYQNGELKQLLKEDQYQKYQFEIRNNNRLRITAVDGSSAQNRGRVNADMEADVLKNYSWNNGQFIEI